MILGCILDWIIMKCYSCERGEVIIGCNFEMLGEDVSIFRMCNSFEGCGNKIGWWVSVVSLV